MASKPSRPDPLVPHLGVSFGHGFDLDAPGKPGASQECLQGIPWTPQMESLGRPRKACLECAGTTNKNPLDAPGMPARRNAMPGPLIKSRGFSENENGLRISTIVDRKGVAGGRWSLAANHTVLLAKHTMLEPKPG